MSYLRADIQAIWQQQDPLQAAFALEGEIFRDMPGRRTMRVQLGDRHYFVKLHYGVGWREVVKNWLQFKHPVIGAQNEFDACRQLTDLGITAPRPAAFAKSAGSLASQRSFVLCDELVGYTTLEDLTEAWAQTPPDPQLRRRLLYAVAAFARSFHGHGFIHRDFYICHLLVQNAALEEHRVELAVLDLHRARRFARIPDRWLKRDLAALLFSTLHIPLSTREQLRFLRLYTQRPLREELAARGGFWRAVVERAHKLYVKDQRKRAET
ncbi:MAG: lipopolysaccharide core heptose(I) kinase RfaP [Pseudomonadales bacterium]